MIWESRKVLKYDMRADVWTEIVELPMRPSDFEGVVILGEDLYIFGWPDENGSANLVKKLNLESGVISPTALPMPPKREGALHLFESDGCIYLIYCLDDVYIRGINCCYVLKPEVGPFWIPLPLHG